MKIFSAVVALLFASSAAARVSSYKPMNLAAEDPAEDDCDAECQACDKADQAYQDCFGKECDKCEDEAGEDDAKIDACYAEGGACGGKEDECGALETAADEACGDDDDEAGEGGDGGDGGSPGEPGAPGYYTPVSSPAYASA